MTSFPRILEHPPLLLHFLMMQLKVRDVMSRELITVRMNQTIHEARILMKENGITGLPVVERKRLRGILSINDVIDALELGLMDNPVSRHMTRQVVTLQDDMPLTMAISYFGQYPYGRFPVLNTAGEPVGIITSRNVNLSLLVELLNEMNRREHPQTEPQLHADTLNLVKTRRVEKYDFEHAGSASTDIKRFLESRRMDPVLLRRIAVASYELEMNLICHSVGGTMSFLISPDRVEIVAQDYGPGIANVSQALEEGFSTANDWIKSLGFGAGMGLNSVQRVSDDLQLASTPGEGTVAKAVIHIPNPAAAAAGNQQTREDETP